MQLHGYLGDLSQDEEGCADYGEKLEIFGDPQWICAIEIIDRKDYVRSAGKGAMCG